ncbi:MAG: cytochrome P460 family protein [Myxococcota bacterium]
MTRRTLHWLIASSAVALTAAASFLPIRPAAGERAGPYRFNGQGELVRPTGYREWIYVGTPVTPNDLNDGKAPFPEFHNVYIEPSAWRHWKTKGEFPDGTILVKELVGVGSKVAVSGKGYFMGDYVGLEATIKSKKRFPKEPGHWAYFSFSTPDHATLKASAKAFPTAACNACHQASAAHDFVFLQYYPVLREGRKAGREAAGGHRDRL